MLRNLILLLALALLSVNGTTVFAKQDSPNLANHRIDEGSLDDVGDLDVHRIDPSAVTNSHKPQYYKNNKDAVTEASTQREGTRKTLEIQLQQQQSQAQKFVVDPDDEDYRPSHHMKNRHVQIKNVLIKLLQRSEQRAKFANVLPILKVLTPPQRLVLASLITKQVTSDARSPALTTAQVEAMFGNDVNVTSDLMLPILLDIANLVRETKDHVRTQLLATRTPQAQMLRRRSFEGADDDIELIDTVDRSEPTQMQGRSMKIAARIPSAAKKKVNESVDIHDDTLDDFKLMNSTEADGLLTIILASTANGTELANATSLVYTNGTLIAEDAPVAEKLRALNRFIDRHGNLIVKHRPNWNSGLSKNNLQNRQPVEQQHRRPASTRKPYAQRPKPKCDLFTNNVCLDSVDYPTDAIMGSIRRNQMSMNALLADFPEISADTAIDGVSAKQENKYTPDFYNTNRREDGSGGPASGFMCPSTVKYARPQKARATSGQWKYIVNTGEHTQTLRLEKCLRPKESCTYLTDNFKSKCVQVYNYHRLLTWDQENGLHMDIFKVPTCCSCHIEGYSVNFPPLSSKPLQSPIERFPGQDIQSGDDLRQFEDIQPSFRQPIHKFPTSPLDVHNYIPGSSFSKQSFPDEPFLQNVKHIPLQFDPTGDYQPDLFQHPTTNVKSVKRPPRIPLTNEAGLPSFLEPPSKPAVFDNSPVPKHKPTPNSHFKRGTQNSIPGKRPARRPLRKKTTNVNEDQLVGATSVHESHESPPTIINLNSFEDIDDSAEEFERTSPRVPSPASVRTTPRTIVSTAKITIKNVATTTERYRPKPTQPEQVTPTLRDVPNNNNRRVNYNYHPIIDFFEEAARKEAADRMDMGSYSSEETDWRPMVKTAAFPLKAPMPEKNANQH